MRCLRTSCISCHFELNLMWTWRTCPTRTQQTKCSLTPSNRTPQRILGRFSPPFPGIYKLFQKVLTFYRIQHFCRQIKVQSKLNVEQIVPITCSQSPFHHKKGKNHFSNGTVTKLILPALRMCPARKMHPVPSMASAMCSKGDLWHSCSPSTHGCSSHTGGRNHPLHCQQCLAEGSMLCGSDRLSLSPGYLSPRTSQFQRIWITQFQK